MDANLKVVLIVVSAVILTVVMAITKALTRRVSLIKKLEPHRRKVVLNVAYLIYLVVFAVSIVVVLGIDLNDVALFVSSVLAILGIAFFAQWSLLSNLTACIILFFYHPLKIGDRIRILDSEFDFEGMVADITGFHVIVKTEDGREITIPNTVILQKGIELLDSEP